MTKADFKRWYTAVRTLSHNMPNGYRVLGTFAGIKMAQGSLQEWRNGLRRVHGSHAVAWRTDYFYTSMSMDKLRAMGNAGRLWRGRTVKELRAMRLAQPEAFRLP